jgi:F-type H+-transporting ATPase subunit a
VIVPGIVGLWFDIIDGVIQAVVFAYLTMSYIGENLETYNEYIEHPEEHQKKKKAKKSKKSEAVAA